MISKALSPIELSILIAIGHEERHGYEIMKEIEQASEGRQKVGPGTLYVAIKRLINEGHLKEAEDKRTTRRRYYFLTSNGKKAIQAEVSAYQNTIKWATRQGLATNL
jgi:DNA-binding PadR family transcriptional regulator